MNGWTSWRRKRRDERGSVAIEAAIGVPAFGLFVAMIILGGRVEIAKQAVEASQTEAISSGKSAATSSLNDQGLQCATTDITVNAAAFNAPLGTTAQVTATVTCKVDLADLSIPGLPGTRTITATASSPVDAYRERR
jgi:Flp pilus assembly protein TadG